MEVPQAVEAPHGGATGWGSTPRTGIMKHTGIERRLGLERRGVPGCGGEKRETGPCQDPNFWVITRESQVNFSLLSLTKRTENWFEKCRKSGAQTSHNNRQEFHFLESFCGCLKSLVVLVSSMPQEQRRNAHRL